MEPKLGYHVSKEKTYTKTFQNVINDSERIESVKNFPIQIFTGSTKMWKRGVQNEKDLKIAKKLVNDNNMNVFIHSIYLINLSRIGEEFEKAKECLKYDLDIGPKMGAKGVVVHVGKALKMGNTKAVDNMFKNMALTQLAIAALKFRGESYSFSSLSANSEALTKQKKLIGSRNIK